MPPNTLTPEMRADELYRSLSIICEWCDHGAQKVWNMMKEEGLSAEKRTILRVCQIFASTIRSFKHAKQEN